jgi:hypothetical protein
MFAGDAWSLVAVQVLSKVERMRLLQWHLFSPPMGHINTPLGARGGVNKKIPQNP